MSVTHYEVEGRTAVIQMDDGKANALSFDMITELLDAIARAESEASAIVLAGRPERFCAGFDLKVMMSGAEAVKALLRRGAELFTRLYGSPLPVVAACTGHALAGGALVLLTADVRVGALGAFRIGLNEVSIGMPLPLLAIELARARLQTTGLCRATLLGEVFAPEAATTIGFLDEAVAPTEVLGRAKAEAARLGELSRRAFHGTKTRLRQKAIELIVTVLEDDLEAITSGVR